MFEDVIKENEKIDQKIKMDWEKSDRSTFADARYVMMEHFCTDDDLERGYIANIAMFIHDRCGITDYKKRNELAKELFKKLYM